jgi:hypothetical protein
VRFLLLLVSLVAGALIGWLSVLAGLWFLMPLIPICAGIVSIALSNEFRWRIVAFSVGLFLMFGFQLSELARGIQEGERQYKLGAERQKQREQQLKKNPLPSGMDPG